MTSWSSLVRLLQLILLLALCRRSTGSSVLGVAAFGARSHYMLMLRLGQELAERGHTFAILVSDSDAINLDTVKLRSFPGLQVFAFKGPPENLAAHSTRVPKKVLVTGQAVTCRIRTHDYARGRRRT